MNTTLNRIRSYKPYPNCWKRLLKGLGKTKADDEPLDLVTILDINGLDDAIWSLRCIDDQAQVRRYADWCDHQARLLMTGPFPLTALDSGQDAARTASLVARIAAGASAWAAAWAAQDTKGGVVKGTENDMWLSDAAWSSGAVWAAMRAAHRARRTMQLAQEKQFRVMFGGAT